MSIFIEFMALILRHKRFNNKSEQICDHSDLYTVNFSDIRYKRGDIYQAQGSRIDMCFWGIISDVEVGKRE